jgi:hypothetical protein
MLKETRRIEKNMISKLNCMYFVARKVSLPTIETLLKKEKSENNDDLYKGFTKQVNDLINLYFSIEKEGNSLKYPKTINYENSKFKNIVLI